jgi:hypothetical protein
VEFVVVSHTQVWVLIATDRDIFVIYSISILAKSLPPILLQYIDLPQEAHHRDFPPRAEAERVSQLGVVRQESFTESLSD